MIAFTELNNSITVIIILQFLKYWCFHFLCFYLKICTVLPLIHIIKAFMGIDLPGPRAISQAFLTRIGESSTFSSLVFFCIELLGKDVKAVYYGIMLCLSLVSTAIKSRWTYDRFNVLMFRPVQNK